MLRLGARGLSTRAMAAASALSERAVAHHVQHIYAKIGVSTGGAAALFAARHGLAGPGAPPAATTDTAAGAYGSR